MHAEWLQAQKARDAARNQSGAEAELEALRLRMLKQVVSRMLHAKMAAAWSVWHGSYVQARGARRALKRMIHGRLSRTLEHWREVAATLVDARIKVRRCVLKIVRRQMCGAWYRWANMAAEAVEMRRTLQKVAMKLANRSLGTAFASWHNNWADNKVLRIRLKAMVKRARNMHLAGSIDRWTEAVDEILDLRRKMTKIVNRMRQRAVSQVYYAWSEVVDTINFERDNPQVIEASLSPEEMTRALFERDQKQKVKERNDLDRRLRKVAASMIHRRVAAALATWYAEHEKFRQLKRIATRMLHAHLAWSFLRWVDAWEEVRHARGVMLRIAHRMKHRRGLAALERWRDATDEANTTRVLIKRALKKMIKRQVAAAYERWCDVAGEAKAMRILIKRALGKIMKRQLCAGFDRWREMTEEAADLRDKLRRCAAMMTNKAVVSTWRLWRAGVERGKEERAANEALVTHAVRKMLNRQIAAAWDLWKDKYVTWRDFVMPKLKLAAGRILNRVATGAFITWVHAVQAAVEARADAERAKMDCVSRIVRRIMNRALSDTFSAWHGATRDALEIEIKVRRAHSNTRRRRLARSYTGWMAVVDRMKARRIVLVRAWQRTEKQRMAAAWHTWKEDVRARLVTRLNDKNIEKALQATCFALLPQLEAAHQILMDWVRAGGLRAMGGVVGADMKLGTRKVLGEVQDMVGFLQSLVEGDRAVAVYRDRAEDVVEAATEVLQAVMHHVSTEAVYVRKALLMMREARAKHATDLKTERVRMLSVLRTRLAALLRTEEERVRASFMRLTHAVKREGSRTSGVSLSGSLGGSLGGGRRGGHTTGAGCGGNSGDPLSTGGLNTGTLDPSNLHPSQHQHGHFASAEGSFPMHMQPLVPVSGAPKSSLLGEGELSAESRAAIERLVSAVAGLEQASFEWEDFSERLIDAGETYTSAGGVVIVNEDDDAVAPSTITCGLEDFQALLGQQFDSMSGRQPPRQQQAPQVRESDNTKVRESSLDPAALSIFGSSRASTKAEDTAEVPAASARIRPQSAADECGASDVSRPTHKSRAGSARVDARLSQMESRGSTTTTENGGPSHASSHQSTHVHRVARLSVHELRADVQVPTAKLPLLPIPRRLKEKLLYHERNRPATSGAQLLTDTAAAALLSEEDSSSSHRSPSLVTSVSGRDGDAHFEAQMDAALAARSHHRGGMQSPRPRLLTPAAGGHGTRPTNAGTLARGPSMLSGAHMSNTNSSPALYITRRSSPPRRQIGGGMELEGRHAGTRAGRFVRPFKTAASQLWNVSDEPWRVAGVNGNGDVDGKRAGSGRAALVGRSNSFAGGGVNGTSTGGRTGLVVRKSPSLVNPVAPVNPVTPVYPLYPVCSGRGVLETRHRSWRSKVLRIFLSICSEHLFLSLFSEHLF